MDSAIDVKSYAPENGIIHAGLVQLNTISQYLTDLPDTAIAELLVAPEDMSLIDFGGISSPATSMKRIRDVKDYHGLDGIQIFDRGEKDPDLLYTREQLEVIYELSAEEIEIAPAYEENLAQYLKAAFAQAQSSCKPLTTGFFMPTNQIVNGRKMGSSLVSVANNLFSNRDELNMSGIQITKQGMDEPAYFLSSCSADSGLGPNAVSIVSFENGATGVAHKHYSQVPARPVALTIQP